MKCRAIAAMVAVLLSAAAAATGCGANTAESSTEAGTTERGSASSADSSSDVQDSAEEGTSMGTASEVTETPSPETSERGEDEEAPSYTYHLTSHREYGYDYLGDESNTLLSSAFYDLLDLQDEINPDTGETLGSTKADAAVRQAIDAINQDTENESAGFTDNERQEVRDDYNSREDKSTFGNYADENTLRVERADSRTFSVVRSHYQFLGGAHGYTDITAYNYDARTGKELHLSDVLNSTDGLADTLYQEVVKQSSDDQAAGLDEDAQDTIRQMVNNTLNESADENASAGAAKGSTGAAGSSEDQNEAPTVTWYIGRDGIHFVFNAYDIGPYAAGAYICVLTPKEYPDLVTTYYAEGPESCVTSVSLYEPNVVNGEELTITPDWSDDTQAINTIDVTYGDKNLSLDAYAYSVDCAVITVPNGTYLYINEHSDNDWEDIQVIDLGEDELTARDAQVGFYGSVLTDPDNMILGTRTSLMSTAGILKAFHVGEHGVPMDNTKFWLINGYAGDLVLTLKEDASFDVLDAADSDTTHEEAFQKGDTFTLYRTDDGITVDAKTGDGRLVRFRVDSSSYPQVINGQYNLEDLFDGTVFAG